MLAAGSGARFGGRKLTARWRGGVLLDGALAVAFAAPVRTVTVVTGADPKVAGAAGKFAAAHSETGRLKLVHAADHAEGMAATLRTGIASLPADTAAAFVFLGDMPRVPVAVLADLVAAIRGGAKAAAPVFKDQRGHPVLFSATVFADLLALKGDEGARVLLRGLGSDLALVTTADRGVLLDVDRPEDLEEGML